MMGAGCCERGAESEKLRAEVASLRSEVETLRHRVERMEREAVASARPSRGAPSSAADRRDLMQRREAMKDPELRRKFIEERRATAEERRRQHDEERRAAHERRAQARESRQVSGKENRENNVPADDAAAK